MCSTHRSGLTGHRFSLWKLDSYVNNYTGRTLSYGSDTLPAFQGVMHRYEAMTGERLYWGLSYKIVDMGNSLMWETQFDFPSDDERQDLRQLRLDDGTTIHMLYPSWSWMRWNGVVHWCLSFLFDGTGPFDSGSVRPELDFYRLMSDGRVELLAPRNQPIPAGVPDESLGRFAHPLTRLWKGPTAIDGPVLTNPDDGGLVQEVVPAQPESTSRPISVYDTGRLVFRTSHARIKTWSVSGPQTGRLEDRVDLHLQLPGRVVAASDKWHGADIVTSFQMPLNTSRRLFGRWHATRELGNDAASLLLSYVVVGENYNRELHVKEKIDYMLSDVGFGFGRDLRVLEESEYYQDTLLPLKPAVLNVLIIEWVNEERGIARRVGTALFPEPEWMALDRDWRLIILE